RELAQLIGGTGAAFADVALMRPVPDNGLATPALASGPGAERFAAAVGPLGMPVTLVGDQPGDAAARKLAHSVFAKGLAAAVGESLAAAERLRSAEWLYAGLARTLESAAAARLPRLLAGSRIHPAR